MKTINYHEHDQFAKQLKKLIRKHKSLREDINEAKKSAIELFHIHKLDNGSVELIPKFDSQNIQIYKLRKFACKSLKGKGIKSGIRIIYAFYQNVLKVELLEIYFKEKNNSDMNYKFIQNYFNTNHQN